MSSDTQLAEAIIGAAMKVLNALAKLAGVHFHRRHLPAGGGNHRKALCA